MIIVTSHLCMLQKVKDSLEGLPRDKQLGVTVSQPVFPPEDLSQGRRLLRC